ncbi:MAG TPA: FtsX-like permease family protein, partial [Actinomycetota bacterium]|nr:FtsX-like permease family protein [Actinomycetota bacterium]
MTRLGLRLILRTGREALVRLALTTIAVAIGVTVLLAVFADFHAFQATSRRPSWESTTAASGNPGSTSNLELWNFSENIYKGQFIEQLDVAALGPNAPVVPGLPRLPKSGEFYASPALSRLLRTVPRDELGARFPGAEVGAIGQAGLSGPEELVAIVGYAPAELAALPNTIRVDKIATAPQSQGTTNLYRLAFGIGAIAILFPLLILITTATRLSAARREERYAAIRLVGGTPNQINVLASVDAVMGALFGTLLGIGVFLLVRPVLANVAFSGARFFPGYVTPTGWGYVGMLVVVPIGSAVASLVSLRRVQISPLGVSRKTTPPAPGPWRVIPLLVGIPLFVYPVLHDPQQPSPGPVFIGLLLILVGLVVGGSWLTMIAARAMAKVSRGAASLLAARRLGANPKASFRSVSGLVLAVFVGTGIAVLAPAVNAAQSPTGHASLTNVLRVPLHNGQAETGAKLLQELQAYPGVTVIPIYENPSFGSGGPPPPSSGSGSDSTGLIPGAAGASFDSVIGCASLEQLSVLGRCAPGAKAVMMDGQTLFTDNPLYIYRNLPLVSPRSPATSVNVTGLSMTALLVKTEAPDTLEKVRTFLTGFVATIPTGGVVVPLEVWQMGGAEPQTFGEVAQTRNNDYNNLERVVLVVLGLTLLVAGCSLAVTAGGSLVERKRPLTLLRVSGTPTSVLRRVVLLEA